MKGDARHGISDDLCRLSFAHPGELIFLEIVIDPQAVSRHDGQELGANRRIGADARTAIADDPVDRRVDFRGAQIEARQIAISVGLIDVSRSLPTLGIDDLELAAGSLAGTAPSCGPDRFSWRRSPFTASLPIGSICVCC
jgi:hypothetical protein